MHKALPCNSYRVFISVTLALFAVTAHADLSLTLNNSFIEKYKNRVTISTDFVIDKAHAKPNASSKDGDLHIAGRSRDIKLATVAEIMNATDESEALTAISDIAGSGNPMRMAGAWRLWPEHGGSDERHVQGKALAPFDTTNPDHLFEIHPVTLVGSVDVSRSLRPIDGYTTKLASTAFPHYESKAFRIYPSAKTTRMVFPGVGYNYVKFTIELNHEPLLVEDGAFVFAKVRDEDGHLLVRNRRMAFVNGSPPEVALRNKRKGDCMVVLGIPRIDLALVAWRVANAKKRPEVLTWSMPYEMIVAGVYDETCEAD